MPVMSATSLPKTPLDYVAEGYWQDFLAKRPIAGGIAYEAELHNCQLDESLLSLQRVDTLLTQMRRDMAKAGTWNETVLLTNEQYRNLLVFLGFYAGRVLARQWQNTAHWYGQFELRSRYPELPLITDDFYHHMAVLYDEDSVANDVQGDSIQANGMNGRIVPVFFALEPVGLRLFGHIDRQFEAVEGGQVASGLYQAVSARLPHVVSDNNTTLSTSASNPSTRLNTGSNAILTASKSVTLTKPLENDVNAERAVDAVINVAPGIADKVVTNIPITAAETAHNTVPINTNLKNNVPTNTIAEIVPKTTVAPKSSVPETSEPLSKAPPTPEIFTQLLIELDEIEVVQTAGNADYQQARKTLDQFEQHIAKQHKPRAQVIFSEPHQATKQQALLIMKNSADKGNTAAMLRLGMYEVLGEGLSIDNSVNAADNKDTAASKEAGIEWVKQAANKKDSRAQRLLSKMYYQGIGVPQDINSGKHWLEQAAENGHVEAISLVAQWQQAQALITTRQQEQHSIKRYQLLIGVVIIAALLLIIFV